MNMRGIFGEILVFLMTSAEILDPNVKLLHIRIHMDAEFGSSKFHQVRMRGSSKQRRINKNHILLHSHFLHRNIKSLLSNRHEPRSLANKTRKVVIRITEFKIEHIILDIEEIFQDMIFTDVIEIEMAVVLSVIQRRTCTLKQELCIAKKSCFWQTFIKVDTNYYMSLLQTNLNLKVNEIYLLVDFNVSFLQNGDYILSRKRSAVCQESVHT